MEECRELVYEIIVAALKKHEYLKEREQVKTRNEILPDLKRLSIASKEEYLSAELLELGILIHLAEGYLIVESSPKAPLLEFDTKVCAANGLLVGVIDDILGSVDKPHYSVLAYQTLPAGTLLYYPKYASICASISHKKGTDASNNNDEETSEESSEDHDQENLSQGRNRKKVYKMFEKLPPFE